MTEADIQQHLAGRRACVARYLEHPERYQVCGNCRSVSPVGYGHCPFCGHYRFDYSVSRVISTALSIGSRPFSIYAGVVPRLRV